MKKIIILFSTIISINCFSQKAVILSPANAINENNGNARPQCLPEYIGFEGCCARYAIICDGSLQQVVTVCGSKICQFIDSWNTFVIAQQFPEKVKLDLEFSLITGTELQLKNEPERSIEFSKIKNSILIIDKDTLLTTNKEGIQLIMKAGKYLLKNNKLEVIMDVI